MASKIGLAPFIALLSLLAACQPEIQEQANTNIVASNATQANTSVESSEESASRLLATFPAQQRPPGDPESIIQGELVFDINCRACHGADLRGGDLGGPNLLRSLIVLNDQAGELIAPVIKEGRNNPGMAVMPPFNLSDSDLDAVAAYIHSIVSTSQRQGAPPKGEEVELNIVVGDPEAGQRYFEAQCTDCHSITGDLQGIASIIPNPENLQSSWVSGRRRGAPSANSDRTQIMVTVTLSNGEKVTGKLGRLDDFLVSLTTADNHYRSFTLHENTSPSVLAIEKEDPMQRHRKLLSEYTDEIMHDVTAYLVTLK